MDAPLRSNNQIFLQMYNIFNTFVLTEVCPLDTIMEILDSTSGGDPTPPFVIDVNGTPQVPGAGIEDGNDLTVNPGDVITITPDSVDPPFIILDVKATFEGADSVTVKLVDENGNDVPDFPEVTVSVLNSFLRHVVMKLSC